MKSMIQNDKVLCKTPGSSSTWKRRQERRQNIRKHAPFMKRAILMDGSRRQRNGVVRKVKTLKKLVPNGKFMAVDGLFRETADYILLLETQVKVMQIMVNVLSGSC
ncbi:hypothetical protein ACHQM5_006450 [Ranunculus cassubicifolius]